MNITHILTPGFIEVFTGSMKSGKTLAIVHRLEQLQFANKSFVLFKPDMENRDEFVRSRNMISEFQCIRIPAAEPSKMYQYLSDQAVVVIDEAQFFCESIVDVVKKMARLQKNVIIAGLDLDFRGEPFGAMPELMANSDVVSKFHARCEYANCGEPAKYSQRLIDGEPAPYNSPLVLIGDVEEGYQARCRKHHIVPDIVTKMV